MKDEIKTKVCSKCNAKFPATNEFFSGSKANKDGFQSKCKACQKQYRSDNKERQKQYYQDNKEHLSERMKQYYQDNVERIAEHDKRYYKENAEYIAMCKKQYRKDNAEQIAECRKQYRIENAEYISECNKRYRIDNVEKISEYSKQYYESNKERYIVTNQRREAIKKSLLSDFTLKQWESCLSYFEYKDAYTGLPMDNPSQDHVIPLSKGGGYTMDNIIPCDCRINTSKGNRDMATWFRRQAYYDIERENRILAYLGREA